MPQRITPTTRVVTKDGECHLIITLELDINVNVNGQVNAQSSATPVEEPKSPFEKDYDKVEFTIPDFQPGMKLNFGKEVNDRGEEINPQAW